MIVIKSAFTGYPDGKKRVFSVDQEVDDLGASYEAVLIEKGLAEKSGKKAKSNEAK